MIYEILKKKGANGPDRAITTAQLMDYTKLELRELRRQVQLERKRHIICGKTYGDGGYYRPATRGQIAAYRKLFEQRIEQFGETLRLPYRMMKHKAQ